MKYQIRLHLFGRLSSFELVNGTIGIGLLLLALARPCGAVEVFDNGQPDLQGGGGRSFIPGNAFMDDFVLSTGANEITGMRWWGTYDMHPVTELATFVVSISTMPNLSSENLVLADRNAMALRVDTGLSYDGNPVYEYVLDIDPLELVPGEIYWVSFYYAPVDGDFDGDPGDPVWYWLASNSFAGSAVEGGVGAANIELSFQLTGPDAPLPLTECATLLCGLCVIATGALCLRRRWRTFDKGAASG